MNRRLCFLVVLCLLSGGLVRTGWAKLTPEQLEKLPPPAVHDIDFSKEIRPIFEASCVKCHGRGKAKGGFALDSRTTVLRGGDSGPAILPGNSGGSYLIELVSGLDPDNVMPQKGSKLTREQVGVLRAWIDQGTKWDEDVSFGRLPPVNLKPAVTDVAIGPEAPNAVDSLLQPYYARHHVTPGKLVSDRIFARRVYLDVIGLLPTPEELSAFLDNRRAEKRERLVQDLLADNPRYAQHWLTFWNDLLRNDYKGTGYIDEGRKQITDWLYSALANNMPFDRFVAELVNPTPRSEGFVNGIVWRGVVNASQTPQMQAAQNISQVFMGVNLKCASCHDSFINDWTLADAYGLASIYADGELEMVHCDKPTGQKAAMKFLYPELGTIDPKSSKTDRMKQLADIITQQQNGRLARTIVNRLWAKLMGRGLVEPLDDMEQRAWNVELLDWLSADLVANGYNLRKLLERILISEAYQLESVPASEAAEREYVFHGPLVRRLSAEQFQDALSAVTGVWHSIPTSTQTDFTAGQSTDALAELENPARFRWIWRESTAGAKAAPGTVYFRRTLELKEQPTQAFAVVSCDNSFKLFVNGDEIASGDDHNKPRVVDLTAKVRQGQNVFAILAVNRPGETNEIAPDLGNPAGLLFYARVRQVQFENGVPVTRVWDFGSSDAWLCSTNRAENWTKTDFSDEGWAPATELGGPNMAPWKLERKFAEALSAVALAGHVRASLVEADPLMTALGRPNREQVITSRTTAATTLQALEMTNGKTLADQLERGAKKLLDEQPTLKRDVITTLFERALARPPRPDELRMAADLVGSPARKDGLEDLLWAVAMLPEFQLIY